MTIRVGIDATPLLGPPHRHRPLRRRALLGATLADDDPDGDDLDLVATAFTLRGRGGLAASLPPGVARSARPVPARLLQPVWARGGRPPVELADRAGRRLPRHQLRAAAAAPGGRRA